MGQVTRVYPWLAEVTLITDKGHFVPVQNLRNGLRAVLAGTGSDGALELRFIPVFRRMEVTTSPFRGILGLALNPGRIAFPRDATVARFGHLLRRVVAEPALLAAVKAVRPGGHVYLEAPRRWEDVQLEPFGLRCLRHLKAGAVHAHLLQVGLAGHA